MIKDNLSNKELIELSCFIKNINDNLNSSSMFCSNHQKIILDELRECQKSRLLIVYYENNVLFGACWMYLNMNIKNADVNLFVNKINQDEYNKIAKEMLNELQRRLTSDITYTFYFPKQNISCATFLRSIEAKQNVNEYGLLLKKENVKNIILSSNINKIEKSDYQEFILLFNEVFPNCYISPEEIINDLGQNHEVFVLKENGQINAFSVLKRKSSDLYCAEIIIVRNGYRHNGRGRLVLSYLINKVFENENVDRIDLIVDCNNQNALKLYFDLGFIIEYENNNFTINN